MRQISFLTFLTTLALLMGGCNPFGGGGSESSSSPTPTTSSAAQSPNPSFPNPTVEQQQKPSPAPVQQKPTVVAVTASELIPPTDPDKRRAEVQKEKQQGAKDPFGLIPIPENPPPPEPGSANAPSAQTTANQRSVPQLPGLVIAQPPRLNSGSTNNSGSVPQLPGLAIAQPPRLNSGSTNNSRGVPQLPGLVVAQPPTLNVNDINNNRSVLQLPGVSGVGVPRRTLVQPQRRTPEFTGGLGKLPKPPASTVNTVARRSQRTPSTPTRVARAPQRTQRPATTIARQPQRTPSTPTRVARAPQRTQRPATTVAAAPPTATPNATPTTPAIIAPPQPPEIPVLPPPPDPTLAKGVEVSGVIVVNNEAQAIVKAPNEATTRYVRAGQRLSNGQVLVKRIELSEGSEPIVILEQNGVEVSKVVGEKPIAPAQPGAQPATPAATV